MMSELPNGVHLAFNVAAMALLLVAWRTSERRRAFWSLFTAGLAAYVAAQVVRLVLVAVVSHIPPQGAIRFTNWLAFLLLLVSAAMAVSAVRAASSQTQKLLGIGLGAFIFLPLFSDFQQAFESTVNLPLWIRALTSAIAVAAFGAAAQRRESKPVALLAAGLALVVVPDLWRSSSSLWGQGAKPIPPGLTLGCFVGALACFAFLAAHAENQARRLLAIALAAFVFVGVWNNAALAIDCGFGSPSIPCFSHHVSRNA